MISSLNAQTFDELPGTTEKLYSNIPTRFCNDRVRSGDLLSRGAQRQHGALV